MARPINGILDIVSFSGTATPGEYQIENAIYTNYADNSGSGAYALAVGFLLYTQSMDLNTAMPLPGVYHRYKITSVSVIDPTTINATILWDQPGAEEDVPMSGASCIISQPSINNGYGFPALDSVYPTLPPGMTVGAMMLDVTDITDLRVSPTGGGGSSISYVKEVTLADYIWTVNHDKNSINYTYTIFNEAGVAVIADEVKTINANTIQVSFSMQLAGRAVFSFY